MKSKRLLLTGLAALVVAAVAGFYARDLLSARNPFDGGYGASTRAVPEAMKEIVAAYRKVILLAEDESRLDDEGRRRIPVVGKMLFSQNQDRLQELSEQLRSDGEGRRIEAFLDALERGLDLRDGDKLAFIDVLDDVSRSAAVWRQEARVQADLEALGAIQARYEVELRRVMERIGTRGMPVQRESWDNYVGFLRTLYSARAVIAEFPEAGQEPTAVTRGGGAHNELSGRELPAKTVALTFDDGPHARYTDQILAILRDQGVPSAVFFEVGHNVGNVNGDGSVKLGRIATVSRRVLEAGHVLANHSYTHSVLTKLAPSGQTEEIADTSRLLKEVSGTNVGLFRPPYGARNDAVLAAVEKGGMKSIMWNIDSRDWADPVPASIAKRVIDAVEQEGRGIILFHDIQGRTVQALPQVIAGLKARGYRFAGWDGERFSVSATAKPAAETAEKPVAQNEPLYRESWAVVIGIDEYKKWPHLRYAVNDAAGIRDVLVNRFGFKTQNVFMLANGEATREAILSLFTDKLSNPDLVKREDRVFVFFAGHGATRKLASGRDLGYIIPVDADTRNYPSQSISMTDIQDAAESIPAKHLLFVMDSCYSGLAFTRGGGQNYLQEVLKRSARQMLTAGGADQEVADGGPNGHSVFTWTLLQALEGKGDLNGDNYITGSELGAYLVPVVSSVSRQTPAFGNLPGSAGGEFVFELAHRSEFLNNDSTQLSDAGVSLNGEIDALRSENRRLKEQLAAAEATFQKQRFERPASPVESAAGHNDRGLRLFREKQYAAAAEEFLAAARIDPRSAEFANNAGFAYFKVGRNAEAVEQYRKAIAIDNRRAVAYLNLGDALAALGRNSEAAAAYERHLALQPASRRADELRQIIEKLRTS